MNANTRRWSVKCPHCGSPKLYNEVLFSATNDPGYWVVACGKCSQQYWVELGNPEDSYPRADVIEVGFDAYIGSVVKATEKALTNIPPHQVEHVFDREALAIYVCQKADVALEAAAYEALDASFKAVGAQYANAANMACANYRAVPDSDFAVARVQAPCACGDAHFATFYCEFKTNEWAPRDLSDWHLADISGCDLSEALDGLFTKTEIMQALEKLVIRWRLIMDQTLVAAPFIGHQYLKPEQKLSVWKWLIDLLDPKISVLLTRGKSFAAYKQVLQDVDGLDHSALEEFGLASQLIAADTKKHDFHAKFFVGVSSQACEVLSGSANLVKGKSIENIAFRGMSHATFKRRYLDKFKVKAMPTPQVRTSHFVSIAQDDHGNWLYCPRTGSRLL